MSREIDGLPVAEFAFPGELRDRLVAAILRGEKTSTCTLLVDYERAGDALPEVGTRSVVVDSEEQPVAVIETTELRVLPLGEVDLAFARDEGRASSLSPTGAWLTRASGPRTSPTWPWTTTRPSWPSASGWSTSFSSRCRRPAGRRPPAAGEVRRRRARRRA